jgi:hypothetical protein
MSDTEVRAASTKRDVVLRCSTCHEVLHREFGMFGTWLHPDGLSIGLVRRSMLSSVLHFADPE